MWRGAVLLRCAQVELLCRRRNGWAELLSWRFKLIVAEAFAFRYPCVNNVYSDRLYACCRHFHVTIDHASSLPGSKQFNG